MGRHSTNHFAMHCTDIRVKYNFNLFFFKHAPKKFSIVVDSFNACQSSLKRTSGVVYYAHNAESLSPNYQLQY